MRGHERYVWGCCVSTSYVNDICYSVDQQHIVSASSDGTIRVWDIATTNCLRVVEPARVAQSFADISVEKRRECDVDCADSADGAESGVFLRNPAVESGICNEYPWRVAVHIPNRSRRCSVYRGVHVCPCEQLREGVRNRASICIV